MTYASGMLIANKIKIYGHEIVLPQKVKAMRIHTGIITAVLLSALSLSAEATIINPDPTTWGADDGAELFTPRTNVWSFEYYDSRSSNLFGSEFGFYFADDPTTLIPIFQFLDQGTLPYSQRAYINFDYGIVRDQDDSSIQNFFTPSSSDIGFYLSIPTFNAGSLVTTTTIYTESSRNAGLDLAATFPKLANPSTYMIGFENTDGTTLAFEKVNHLIPEPPSLSLLLMGMIGAWFVKRSKRSLTA
jgi:hypothetical protein